MKMKPILVVCCTKGNKTDTKLYQSLSIMSRTEVKLKFHEKNTTGLPEIYNKYINSKYLKKHDIVLFVHDDVYIDDLKLRGKLYSYIQAFDITGVAGCVKPVIKSPALWHLMAERENHRGYVSHTITTPHGEPGVVCTSFGYTPSRVVLIDGLFMAVNLQRALLIDWKFNTNFNFHHYDMSSCLDANKKMLRIGVAPINIIHDSPGLKSLNDKNFLESQDTFLKLYK